MMSDPLSELPGCKGNVHIAQRKISGTWNHIGQVGTEASMRDWWSALGSGTTRSPGSLKAPWIWLVEVPGVKQPAIGVAPVAPLNLSSAPWPVFLEEIVLMSAGFSVATIEQREL